MKTLDATVLSILKRQPHRIRDRSDDQSKDTALTCWRMRISYPGPYTVYEVELREPFKNFACKKYMIGVNGLVEFDLFAEPQAAAGDRIQIDAYEPGEKFLGGGGLWGLPTHD
jgi:hypothetical protein